MTENRYRRRRYNLNPGRLVVSILLTASFVLQSMIFVYAKEKPEKLISATYCSDAWAVNFWNTESNNMQEELAQIRADGFNSIILVVPWREFQPSTSPVSYNPYAWEKLHRVMAAAREQDLWVMLRVGYTWDYYDNSSVLPRFEGLLYENGGTKDAWLAYVRKLYDETSGYPNFYGGFITWEDFWNFTDKAGKQGTNSAGLAAEIGYQTYLQEHYTLEEINRIYQTDFRSYDKIYLPLREDYAYKLFYEYYDDFLNQLLAGSQLVFPELSLEVRLDLDPVTDEDGSGMVGVGHHGTFGCGDSPYATAMYSVSMGQEPGHSITSREAVEEMERQLATATAAAGGKKIYLDQFLYMDETEEFAHNTQLYKEEREQFLVDSIPVLNSMTMGYGIWTYRNYTDNIIYNSQFALGAERWVMTGSCNVINRNGNMAASFSGKQGSISQTIYSRLTGSVTPVKVRFYAASEKPVDLTVTIGGVSKSLLIHGEQEIVLDFNRLNPDHIKFSAGGELILDNINVYSYEQDGQLYDLDGNELSCMASMRILNAGMQ